MPDILFCAGPCGAFRILRTAGRITSVDLLTSPAGHGWPGAPPEADDRDVKRSAHDHALNITPTGRGPAGIQTALRALKSYFLLRRNPFISVHHFSFDGLTDFTRNVILGTRRVPMGRTVTYTEFARILDLPPGCRRAVGGALGRNPFPIFFPCHRIVGSGGLGGFSSGTAWKRMLLAHEGVSVE